MKVTVKEKSQAKEYPWIGIHQKGCIVLFLSDNNGSYLFLPEHQDHNPDPMFWVEEHFKPFVGEIVLSND